MGSIKSEIAWNPWHGCKKYSEGCVNCYVFRIDGKFDRDSSQVTKNADYDLPVRKDSRGEYNIPTGSDVFTCLSSDFFLDAADEWRDGAWKMIKERADLNFIIITKRIARFYSELPADWGDGYDNVKICVTCENQRRADERLPIFLSLPIKNKGIICEPLLGEIDISEYLSEANSTPEGKIESVSVGGESGEGARVCDYNWVLGLRDNCVMNEVSFCFRQTGANFRKDGKIYKIPREKQHSQAKLAGIDFL